MNSSFNENSPEIGELIDEKQYPDFWQQVENFKKFSQDVGQTVVGNQTVFVSPEQSNLRMATCMECPDFNHEQKRCYLCGCFMEHKVKFTASKCPASKW